MIILCNKRTLIIVCLILTLSYIYGGIVSYINWNKSKPVSKREVRITNKVIIIDPGHGGVDSGTCYNNLIEKEINLELAKKLKRLLVKKGAKVIMTRQRDKSLDNLNQKYKSRHKRDLRARVDIINKYKAELFISIHVNYFPEKIRIRGPITFYQDINSKNKILAQKIQNRLNRIKYQGIKMKNNSIRRGNYYILKNSKEVGVLIEVGFINKKTDNWLLKQNKFKNALVYQIYRGIIDYLNSK